MDINITLCATSKTKMYQNNKLPLYASAYLILILCMIDLIRYDFFLRGVKQKLTESYFLLLSLQTCHLYSAILAVGDIFGYGMLRYLEFFHMQITVFYSSQSSMRTEISTNTHTHTHIWLIVEN